MGSPASWHTRASARSTGKARNASTAEVTHAAMWSPSGSRRPRQAKPALEQDSEYRRRHHHFCRGGEDCEGLHSVRPGKAAPEMRHRGGKYANRPCVSLARPARNCQPRKKSSNSRSSMLSSPGSGHCMEFQSGASYPCSRKRDVLLQALAPANCPQTGALKPNMRRPETKAFKPKGEMHGALHGLGQRATRLRSKHTAASCSRQRLPSPLVGACGGGRLFTGTHKTTREATRLGDRRLRATWKAVCPGPRGCHATRLHVGMASQGHAEHKQPLLIRWKRPGASPDSIAGASRLQGGDAHGLLAAFQMRILPSWRCMPKRAWLRRAASKAA